MPQQTIQVQSTQLEYFISYVKRGDYRIPRFQREFVCKESKIIESFDSIYRGYPIGSFFIWRAAKKYNYLLNYNFEYVSGIISAEHSWSYTSKDNPELDEN